MRSSQSSEHKPSMALVRLGMTSPGMFCGSRCPGQVIYLIVSVLMYIKSPFWIFQCYPIIPEYTCIPRTFNIIFQSGFLWVEYGWIREAEVLLGLARFSTFEPCQSPPRNSHGTRWNPKHGDCKMLIPMQNVIVWHFINGAMMVFTSAPYQTNLALQDKGHTSIK